MLRGFLGKKIGMTQVFRENGNVVPVTLIEAGPCVVTQVKTIERDGYEAVQLGFGEKGRPNKPMQGHFRSSRSSRYLREVQADSVSEFSVGADPRRRYFLRGGKGRHHRPIKGSRLCRHHEAPWLRGRAENSWAVRPRQSSWLHRRWHHPRQGLQGPQDGWPHGQSSHHCEGPGDRRCGHRPQYSHGQGGHPWGSQQPGADQEGGLAGPAASLCKSQSRINRARPLIPSS